MNKYLKSKTSLFLMEMIITVMLFAGCSAVCVRFFALAHTISEDTRELNESVSLAQGFAEVMRGTNGDIDSIIAHYPEAVKGGEDFFEVFYDKDFNTCKFEDAVYASDVSLQTNGAIQNMEVSVVRLSDYKEIYNLTATKYMNNTKG